MNDIEELRQRVLDAEENFGLISDRHAGYSERLIGLMNTVEERMRDQQGEIERQKPAIDRHRAEIETQKAEIDGQGTVIAQQAEEIEKFKASAARKAEENEQLRTMLHSLLRAIEASRRDVLAEIMVQLDAKVSALMDSCAPEAVAEVEEPAAEEPAEVAAEEPAEVAAEEPAEVAAEVEEPAAEEPAEVAAEVEEPVAEEPAEVATEVEEPAAEEPAEVAAEVEESVAEAEPVAAEGAIATGDILDTSEIAKNSAEPVAEAEECAAEDVVEPAPVAAAAVPESVAKKAASGSLDEIMARVAKLVQETDAAIAAPEPRAAEPAEALEEPARQVSAAGL